MYKKTGIWLLLSVLGITQVQAESRVLREETEWCDIWVPHASQNEKPRVLLVGDSITKGYYGEVASALKDVAYCAKFATSSCVADPAFRLQLQTMLSQYQWDVIHFNNGLHGFDYTEEEYRAGYEQAMNVIKKMAPDATVIIALSTPLREPDGSALNPRINERNLIAMEMVGKNGASVNNLHAISKGHPEYYCDAYHYNPDAISLQAARVVTEIKQKLK